MQSAGTGALGVEEAQEKDALRNKRLQDRCKGVPTVGLVSNIS